jgi:RNA polymerase sigma-70 factor (ECF subfamily)
VTSGFADTVALIRDARAGDARALNAVVARWRQPLLERIRLMMGAEARGAADSSDFFHDLFIEILRDFDSLPRLDERSFLRWATCLARNNIRDALRRHHERAIGDFASSLDCRSLGNLGDRPAPPDIAERNEQVDRLIDALGELAEDHRRVIELRDFDRLSFAEVGRCMGRTENAAQILHHRALIRLGELLRGD